MTLVQTARSLLNPCCVFELKSFVISKRLGYLSKCNNLKPVSDLLAKYTCFDKSTNIHVIVPSYINLRLLTTSSVPLKNYFLNMADFSLKENSDGEETSLSKSLVTHDGKTKAMEECIKVCVPRDPQLRDTEESTDQQNSQATDSVKDSKDLSKGMSKRAFKRLRRKKRVEKQRQIKLESQQGTTTAEDNNDKTKCTDGDIAVEIKSKNMTKKERRRQWKNDEKKEMKGKLSAEQIEELKNLPLKHTNIVTHQEEGDKVFHHREQDGVREYLMRDWSCSTGLRYLIWQSKAQLQELVHLVVEYDKNTTVVNDQPDSQVDEEQHPGFNIGFQHEKRKAEEDLSLDNHGIKKAKTEEDLSLHNQGIKKAKIETKALKTKRPGFSDEKYNETQYYIENGLRKVYPYYYSFTTFTKGRWVGEKILDVFAREFRAQPAEEYERCIKDGTLTVNYEKVDANYHLKYNDLLSNIVHRHEVPVTAEQIPIVHVDEDLVVVDKPSSIPVHPCGRYRHNTMVFILAKEYNLKNLTIHRLDRLTSGLLLFARTPKKAREMEQQIRTRQVTKEYVCRVEGEFPRENIECNEPIEVVSYKIGVCKVGPTGKDCRTEFERLSFNGTTSVVICRPLTGRMHQIRVHLQYLGYPIINDPLYNHTVFGPNKGKGGIFSKPTDQLIQDLIKIHNAENWLGTDGDTEHSMFKDGTDKSEGEEGGSQHNTASPKENSSLVDGGPRIVTSPSLTSTDMIIPTSTTNSHQEISHTNKALNGCSSGNVSAVGQVVTVGVGAPIGDLGKNSTRVENAQKKEYSYQASLMTVDNHCNDCKVCYRDPKPRDLVMYLHALKYSGPGWHFETKLPKWAAENWRDLEDE